MDRQSSARLFAPDIAAGAGVAAAVGWAIASLFQAPLMVALPLAGVAFVRVFWSLHCKRTGPRFALAAFQPADFEFEAGENLVELDAVAASLASEQAADAVRGPFPTVQEMQASIRERLNVREAGADRDGVTAAAERGSVPDGADELRAALRDLRRSIG